ncbi:MAG: DUF6364 family protein [Bacteroidota bacterium]
MKNSANLKLTLKLDGAVISSAKKYARTRKTSLSNLIESYLRKLTDEKRPVNKITPLVKSLSGVIRESTDSQTKKDYTDFLINKYK